MRRSRARCTISSSDRGRAGLLALALGAALAVPAWAREITAADLTALPKADVVFLAEVHDNPVHHAHQAQAVAAIAPKAIVFEMILPDQPARLPADRADAAALERALRWAERGWPDFAMYHPIFLAAPGARILGADVPRADLARAMREGAAAVLPDPRLGLATALPEAQQTDLETHLWAAHCFAMPRAMMAPMAEAQRLRDAALAGAVLQGLAETGGPVVVITGAEHARTDRGAPAILARAEAALSILSIGQIEGTPDAPPPHDLWIVTDAPKGRGDPCATFGGVEG